MCLVDGRASAYFSGHGLSFWDTAGPEVILAEVGCTLTADDGTRLAYPLSAKEWKHQGGVVASIGLHHQGIVDGIALALDEVDS